MLLVIFVISIIVFLCFFFFFFNDTATTEIYTLSLHDALPISPSILPAGEGTWKPPGIVKARSEEHTSELQSQFHLVCRLLLEKKKTTHSPDYSHKTTRDAVMRDPPARNM